MYWQIGKRINTEVLGNQRAEYGKQIVATVSTQLQAEFGKKGFEERTIRRMMQFADLFPDLQVVSALVAQLSWSHFLIVMPLKDELQREFYLTMATAEKWSTRTLQSKIDGMLLTLVDNRTNLAKSTVDALRENFGSHIKLYKAAIPIAVKAAEVSSKGKSIYAYDKNSKAAIAYADFTKEVLSDAKTKQRLHAFEPR